MQANISHALPQGCFLPSLVMQGVRLSVFPLLKAEMSDEDIIAGFEEKQPQLDRMRKITCLGCNMKQCPWVMKRGRLQLWQMKEGSLETRRKVGLACLNELFPPTLRQQFEAIGVTVNANQHPSRKNPQLTFYFQRGDFHWSIIVSMASSGNISVNGKQWKQWADLLSVGQAINEALEAFKA